LGESLDGLGYQTCLIRTCVRSGLAGERDPQPLRMKIVAMASLAAAVDESQSLEISDQTANLAGPSGIILIP